MNPDDRAGTAESAPDQVRAVPVTRRRFLVGAGAAGAGGLALGFVGGYTARAQAAVTQTPAVAEPTVDFYGPHQSGIATPAQDRLVFGVFNLAPGATQKEVASTLRGWTDAGHRMTLGQMVGAATAATAPPLDTGEALGSPPAQLTLTIGYGPSFFDDRLGIESKRPAVLSDLPPLPNDDLDPNYTGGDLCVQACSNDPLVAFHAIRNLTRLASGVLVLDWMQLGFGRTSTTSTAQATPRNLLGFKDGTRNIKSEDTDLMDSYVWVGPETDQAWMLGGSYMVARRIRMFIENWDRDYLADQQNVIGRYKASGAPLTGIDEFDAPAFDVTDTTGQPVIPADAHIRLAAFENNGGLRILRRGYSYTDGIDPVRGSLDAGLFFIAFMRHPEQFITLQRKLGASDALVEYIAHVGSAIFACPPGITQDAHWGDDLFT